MKIIAHFSDGCGESFSLSREYAPPHLDVDDTKAVQRHFANKTNQERAITFICNEAQCSRKDLVEYFIVDDLMFHQNMGE